MRALTVFRTAVGLFGDLPHPPPYPPYHHHLCPRHRHAPVCVRNSSSIALEEKALAVGRAAEKGGVGVVEAESTGERLCWSRQICALCSAADPDGALRLLDCLRLRGYRADDLDLAAVLRALCSVNRSAEAHRRLLLHLQLRHAPFSDISLLLAPLLDAHTPFLTLRLLRCLPHAFLPSLSVYNRLIHLLCSLPLPIHAHRLLLEMRSRGRLPDAVSYTALLDGYARLGDVDAARRLLDEMPNPYRPHQGLPPRPPSRGGPAADASPLAGDGAPAATTRWRRRTPCHRRRRFRQPHQLPMPRRTVPRRLPHR